MRVSGEGQVNHRDSPLIEIYIQWGTKLPRDLPGGLR
jgi:hypothetical protein